MQAAPPRGPLSLALLAAAAVGLVALGAPEELIENREGVRHVPRIVAATDARIATLSVPDGFRVSVFARALGAPRMLAAGADGTVFVTRPEHGDVLALRDRDGDGRADARSSALHGLPGVHGIAVHGGQMYLATVHAVYAVRVSGDRLSAPAPLATGLPPGGRHPNRTLAVSPDGRLYVSVGSTCNLCVEPHRFSATIVRVAAGGEPVVFARGLRNTLGFAWHPRTGTMWGMDNGADWLGNSVPPEELNRLQEGGDYGWPFFYGRNRLVELTDYPQKFDAAAARGTAVPSVASYTAHAAPMQMIFYTGPMFPDGYRGDAFVAMRGSWNRRPASGYEVVHVPFDAAGEPQAPRPFLTGFLSPSGAETFGRPVGVTLAADGALLVGDEANGIIYRVTGAR